MTAAVGRFVIPRQAYEALRASAEKHGGVGSGHTHDYRTEAPCCLYGHAAAVDGVDRATAELALHGGPVPETAVTIRALRAVELTWSHSDCAVRRLRYEGEAPYPKRVPFDAYAAELGLEAASDE